MNTFQSMIVTFSTSITKMLKSVTPQSSMQKANIEKNEKQYGGFVEEDWKKVGKDLKLGIIDYGRTR